MYNIPQGQIKFSDIENFCREEHEEDLILDYKSDWPNDLSRILCGMANVQGGMVLIGVNTQPGTRKPAWPPLGVDGTDDNLRQRVVQIAYDSIYPPLFPQIDIARLPTESARAVVVIRVDASRLLHTTDHRRRVYVRVFDHSRGFLNDLADLSQLEWLFQFRQKSIELQQTILTRAAGRASKHSSSNDPIITICMAPVFPQQHQTKTPSELLLVANKIGTIGPRRRTAGFTIPWQLQWRTTSEGAFVLARQYEKQTQYLEIGSYGLVYLEQTILVYEDKERSLRILGAAHVLSVCDAFLNFASKFYANTVWYGPVQLSASIRNVERLILDHRRPGQYNPFVELSPNAYSQDNTVNLQNGEYPASHLAASTDDILKGITYNLMWAFGFPDSREELEQYADRILG